MGVVAIVALLQQRSKLDGVDGLVAMHGTPIQLRQTQRKGGNRRSQNEDATYFWPFQIAGAGLP